MIIICVDNYGRETIADRLVLDNLSEEEAKQMVTSLNNDHGRDDSNFYRMELDDYVLWRGMEELI